VGGGRGSYQRRAEAAAKLRREYSSGGRKERQCDAVECVKEVERDLASFKAKRSTTQVERVKEVKRDSWAIFMARSVTFR
jgi:hypothetical protein